MSHFVLCFHESPFSFNSLINKPQQHFCRRSILHNSF
nr:MAG TPA: hypothetical protein [Caudoviricetes sp.]